MQVNKMRCYPLILALAVLLGSFLIGNAAAKYIYRNTWTATVTFTAELEVPLSEQGPGMGGAMLSMVACGEYPSVEECCSRLCAVASTVVPDPLLVAKYEKR